MAAALNLNHSNILLGILAPCFLNKSPTQKPTSGLRNAWKFRRSLKTSLQSMYLRTSIFSTAWVELPSVCFLIQFATGFAMTFYYRPTVAEAFSSVQYLMTEVNFGWLIRSIHRWSASMMVLMMILHIFRVYLTGGFKKPRELTWVTGVILAVITVSFGVTGYSLPWDQIGYWAVKIVSGVPEAIPVCRFFDR